MKLRMASYLGLLAGVGLLAQLPTLHAQPASSTNYVLELDGTNSYVELPPNIFNDLTEATVEGWVKWKSLRKFSRFFDFGNTWKAIDVCNHGTTDMLSFGISRPPAPSPPKP